MSQPLIITGMHRSGTSFVAELFQSAGLHIGERLFPGDGGNPRGYFEDDEFLTLQRTMLAGACPTGVPGWPDWGWTEAEALDEQRWERHVPAMRALCHARSMHAIWGWKDPRTSLLLETWLRVLPDVKLCLRGARAVEGRGLRAALAGGDLPDASRCRRSCMDVLQPALAGLREKAHRTMRMGGHAAADQLAGC